MKNFHNQYFGLNTLQPRNLGFKSETLRREGFPFILKLISYFIIPVVSDGTNIIVSVYSPQASRESSNF